MGLRLPAAVALGVLLSVALTATARQGSRSLQDRAEEAVYSLDYDLAATLFAEAIAAAPADPAPYRAAAKATWLRILSMRGAVTSDEYLGKMSSSDLVLPAPPSQLAAEFRRNIDKAIRLSEQAVARDPASAAAHYQLGAALGYLASYTGTVEGKVFAAMRSARRAYAEHEKVLKIDPGRHDAGLVVGTYRYIVAGLPMPLRWMAYIVGFGGGREAGIQRLREAAAYPGDSRTDAMFALVLVCNREGRYDEALAVVRELQRMYPRNRLLWLEEGGTALRGRRLAEAGRALDEGIARMRTETRPLTPGEAAQLHYKRAVTRMATRDPAGAERDLRQALADAGCPTWVRGRIHIELGKVADLAGNRRQALSEYQSAITLAERSRDEPAADEAKRLTKSPYRGPR